MPTFTLPLESSVPTFPDYRTTKVEFEEGSEERRNPRSKGYMTWEVTSPNLTTTGVQAWFDFYNSVNGNLDEFDYDDENVTGIQKVRFDGAPKVTRARSIRKVTAVFVEINVNES